MNDWRLTEVLEAARKSPVKAVPDPNWGFLFHYLTAIQYSAKYDRLLITWTLGTLVIAGPKVHEFYDDFCNHRATSLKSDGKDILAVTMVLNAERHFGRTFAESLTPLNSKFQIKRARHFVLPWSQGHPFY